MQSVSINAEAMSFVLALGEVYSTTLCDQVCQRLVKSQCIWFYHGLPQPIKIDSRNIAEILTTGALKMKPLKLIQYIYIYFFIFLFCILLHDHSPILYIISVLIIKSCDLIIIIIKTCDNY